jgi:alpha-beta hydrolase superfamily lysophospholipase
MIAITHREAVFRGAGGTELYWQAWRPEQPRAVLINVHGLGDHSALYPRLVDWLPGKEVAVYAFDARGNGRSPGKRGHVDRWSLFREDLRRFVQLVSDHEQVSPVLLGHSLGGLAVLDYALAYPETIRGVAAAAPVLGSIGTPPPLLWAAWILSRVWPSFTLETGLDLSGLARDPAVIRTVLDDPLFHRRASGRLATEVLGTIASVHARSATLAVPVLIQHGTTDRMVSIDGSRRLATGPAAARVRLREYDALHALYADEGYEERLTDLATWMESLE